MGMRRRWDERGRVEAGIEGWEVVRLRLQRRHKREGRGAGRGAAIFASSFCIPAQGAGGEAPEEGQKAMGGLSIWAKTG